MGGLMPAHDNDGSFLTRFLGDNSVLYEKEGPMTWRCRDESQVGRARNRL